MPPIRSLASKRRAYTVAVILLLGEIMPSYSCCKKKKLVCIIIIVPFSCQPSFYSKYIKLNMHLFYNIRLVSNIKYLYLMRPYSLQSLQLPYLICLRVLYSSIRYKT